MKFAFLLLALFIALECKLTESRLSEEIEDNEFAEFEDFEEEEVKTEVKSKETQETSPKAKGKSFEEDVILEVDNDEDSVIEDEENEFDHFQDEEEFEGFETGTSKSEKKEAPKITITQVPLHLHTNWDSYYLEMLMVAGLIVYFLNFFTGKNKNSKLANMWFYTHKSLLEENFTLVGDDGKIEIENQGLIKESENLYTLWCSGRTCCEGMLVELKLLKRQDLLSVMAQMLRPSTDQIHIRVDMSKEDMDSFVFCIASKKAANKLSREMADLPIGHILNRLGTINIAQLLTLTVTYVLIDLRWFYRIYMTISLSINFLGSVFLKYKDILHVAIYNGFHWDELEAEVLALWKAHFTTALANYSVFCPEKKSGSKLGVPDNFSVMSEIGEVSSAMLDSKILAVLNKYLNIVEYIHFSDQYSGPKQAEDSNVTKLPDVKKVLIFHFNIPVKGQPTQEAMEQIKPLLQLVFYCMDKVKRYRLSKEGKAKADKNRLKVEEAFLKTTHAARAEAAAARREEKKRQEKERILQEDDPEKQRKWEEKEMKRQLKRKAPKMKQLKVKAL